MSFIDDLFKRLRNLWQLSGEIGSPRARAYMQRFQRYEQAWNAYYGKLEKPLKVKPGGPDHNVRINYSRLIVDASVANLFGDELKVTLDEQFAEAQGYLSEWWEAAKMQQVLADCGINGGVCGSGLLRLFDKNAETGLYPRVITINPGVVDVETDPTDYERVLRYFLTYPKNTGNVDGRETGLLVVSVEAGSPADTAGMLIGDILVEFAGQPMPDTDALQSQLGAARIGQATPAAVLRGGELKSLTVNVGERS